MKLFPSLRRAASVLAVSAAVLPVQAAPESVTALDLINLFEKAGGKHPGLRKAHAAGLCAEGTFAPSENEWFAGAPLLSSGELNAQLRFSLAGANPNADPRKPGARGVGLQIGDGGSISHIFTGNSFPVFAGKNPETFYGLVEAGLPGPDGKRDPQKVMEYIKNHPSVQANVAYNRGRGVAASFANTQYWGLHTFFYNPAEGEPVPFRWELVPNAGDKTLAPEAAAELAQDFLETRLAEQIAAGEASFRLEAVIGQPGDSINDPSQQWPEDRERVLLGEVMLTASGGKACEPLNFDPVRVSTGFSTSDDPVLAMRSTAYAISLAKRLSNQ